MSGDAPTNQRLSNLIEQLIGLTKTGELHWERQRGSAHRYARWKNNLLILGPAEPMEAHVARYLFITPFDSPACVEINSNDEELGKAVLRLINTVEESTVQEPSTDPFAITEDILARLT